MRKCFVGLLALGLVFITSESVWAQKGKSYSSGSSSSSSSGSSRPSTPATSSYKPSTPTYKPPASTPVGKSYSTGTTPYNTGTPQTKPQPPPPSSNGWNSGLSDSAKREESKKNYQQATKPAETPKPTYRTSKGEEKPIQANSPQVTSVRKYVTHERYVTYDNRSSTFYGGFYGHPQPYNDFFSPFLMGWIMSDAMNSHQRATWMYHQGPISSGGSIDDARYNEMLRRDAKLQAEIDALKRQNVARDPAYLPEQFKDNPDVIYDKGFVESAYNPEPVPQPEQHSSGAGRFFLWFFLGLLAIVVLGVVGYGIAYVFFIKDFK